MEKDVSAWDGTPLAHTGVGACSVRFLVMV